MGAFCVHAGVCLPLVCMLVVVSPLGAFWWVPPPCVHAGGLVGASLSQLAYVFPFLFFADRLVSVLSIPVVLLYLF